MNVKWTDIVFVLRYGGETLHLWKPLLNTNDQRGSSQCLTQRNTIFVHFTFMLSESYQTAIFCTYPKIIKFILKFATSPVRGSSSPKLRLQNLLKGFHRHRLVIVVTLQFITARFDQKICNLLCLNTFTYN